MKKISFLIICYLVSSIAFAQWAWQNPLPTANLIYSGCFLDSLNGYISGKSGTVMKTADGGLSWQMVLNGYYEDMQSVYFRNVDTGFVIGNGGTVLKTLDGGITWDTKASSLGMLFRIYFFNPDNGFIVGQDGLIARSTDEGDTWSVVRNGNEFLTCIYFISDTVGYASGYTSDLHTVILKTQDGGISWESLNVNIPGSPEDMKFTDGNTGYIVGGQSLILKTTDSGLTWTQSPVILSCDFTSCSFLDNNTGCVAGESHIYKTTDGGTTWKDVSIPSISSLYSVNLIQNTGFVMGGDYYHGADVLKSIDTGSNWNFLSKGTTEHLWSIDFCNKDCGYAVGFGGTVLKTNNAGVDWTSCTATSYDLLSVSCTDPNTVFVSGKNNLIMKSTDAGNTWTNYFGYTNKYLYSTFFLDNNIGFVAGDDGTIYKTINSGTDWSILSDPLYGSIMSIYFLNPDNGFFVNHEGEIYMTNTGGTVWNKVYTATSSLWDISFVNSNSGFIAGDKLILKTIDGGISWTAIPANWTLFSVCFVNEMTGYAVGDYGVVLCTNDGGITWAVTCTGAPSFLRSVTFTDETHGYIAGYFGTILSTNTGGSFVPVYPNKKPANEVTIYPNPAKTEITIEDENASNQGAITISIHGIHGELLKIEEFKNKNRMDLKLDGLDTGIYIVQIRTKSSNETQKLIIL
jgi:photosystem II stability/assembly factor-like uncharacterized protein